MTKYKTDIAAAACSMMELPGTLEGMLHDIHGQVEVSPAAVPSIASSTSPTEAKKKNSSKTSAKVLEQPKIVNGDALWTAFWEQCATESQQPKTVGKCKFLQSRQRYSCNFQEVRSWRLYYSDSS